MKRIALVRSFAWTQKFLDVTSFLRDYDVISGKFWEIHFFYRCDMIFCQNFLKFYMQVAENNSFRKCTKNFFLSLKNEKKNTVFLKFVVQATSPVTLFGFH